MDELEQRIVELREEEDLSRIRPALDGNAIMTLLDIPPGRVVGEALAFLLEIRLDEGEIGADEEEQRLRAWWATRAVAGGGR